jgi:hypothetical protein
MVMDHMPPRDPAPHVTPRPAHRTDRAMSHPDRVTRPQPSRAPNPCARTRVTHSRMAKQFSKWLSTVVISKMIEHLLKIVEHCSKMTDNIIK